MPIDNAIQFGTMISATIISSVILIVLGVIYFSVSLLIIKGAASLVGYVILPDTAVLSAAILTAASLIGSGVGRR